MSTLGLWAISHHHICVGGSDSSMALSLPFYGDHLMAISLARAPAHTSQSRWPWSSGPWLRLRQQEGLETLGFSIAIAGLSFPSVQRESRAVPSLHGIHASPRTWDPVTHTAEVPKTLGDNLGPTQCCPGRSLSLLEQTCCFPLSRTRGCSKSKLFMSQFLSFPRLLPPRIFSFLTLDLTPSGNDQVALTGRERSAPFPLLQAAVYGYHYKNRKRIPHGSPPPALTAA